jgi:hypothetical protein
MMMEQRVSNSERVGKFHTGVSYPGSRHVSLKSLTLKEFANIGELFQSSQSCWANRKPRIGNPGLEFANAFGVVC